MSFFALYIFSPLDFGQHYISEGAADVDSNIIFPVRHCHVSSVSTPQAVGCRGIDFTRVWINRNSIIARRSFD